MESLKAATCLKLLKTSRDVAKFQKMNWNEFKFESSLENSLLKTIEHHLQISIK